MGRRIIVHIGLDKTGSSSLQTTLFSRPLPGITYVHLGAANPSHPLMLIFEPDFEQQAKHIKSVTGRKVTQKVRDEMTARLDATLQAVPADCHAVLSAESIPRFSVPALEAMKAFLARHFDDIEVVGYVRPPVSYMQSRFQHGIRTGRKRNFEVGVGYKDRLLNIDTVFGAENVTLIKFDREMLRDGDVVKDFVHRAGSSISPEEIIKTNESMSLETMSVLFVRNVYGQGNVSPRRNWLLVNALSDLGSGMLKFSADFVAPILEKRRKDIDWVEDRLGVPFWDTASNGPDTLADQESFVALALAQEDGVLGHLAAHTARPETSTQDKAAAVRILKYADPVVRLAAAADLLGELLEKADKPAKAVSAH